MRLAQVRGKNLLGLNSSVSIFSHEMAIGKLTHCVMCAENTNYISLRCFGV